MATITETEVTDLCLGDYLLSFDDDDDDSDGEAGTYDEAAYDEYATKALSSLDARLPDGWRAGTQTDHDGTYLVARNDETGREVSDEKKLLSMLGK